MDCSFTTLRVFAVKLIATIKVKYTRFGFNQVVWIEENVELKASVERMHV